MAKREDLERAFEKGAMCAGEERIMAESAETPSDPAVQAAFMDGYEQALEIVERAKAEKMSRHEKWFLIGDLVGRYQRGLRTAS